VTGAPTISTAVDLRTGDVHVAVAGDVDLAMSSELRDALLAAWDNTGRPVAVDFDRTAFFDAAGLHALVLAWRLITSRGGQLFVASASDPVQRVLMLTGTDTLLLRRAVRSGSHRHN
jgi:anti-sigma B factor antagonist